jgi:hypothetical protein
LRDFSKFRSDGEESPTVLTQLHGLLFQLGMMKAPEYKIKSTPRLGCMEFSCTVDDEDITTSDTTIPFIELQGPITRSQAQQLCHQVNSFLCSSANDLENRLLPNDLIIIRNQGVDHGEHTGHQEGAGEPRKHAQHGGSPSQFEIQDSDFESNSEPRTTLPSN